MIIVKHSNNTFYNLECKGFVSLWNSPVVDCSKLLCCKFSVWHLSVNATKFLIIFSKGAALSVVPLVM